MKKILLFLAFSFSLYSMQVAQEQNLQSTSLVEPYFASPELFTMMSAIHQGDFMKLQQLLQDPHHKIHIDDRFSPQRKTSLHFAVQNNESQCVRELVRANATKTAKDQEGLTPLHLAARLGYAECLAELLPDVNDSEINTLNDASHSALHIAVYHNHLGCVNVLLQKGAFLDVGDRNNNSPLDFAVNRNHNGCINILLQKGAVVTEFVKACLRRPVFRAQDSDGETVLHKAIKKGYRDFVGLLLSNGADKNAKDSFGSTPLHTAVAFEQMDCLQALLNEQADKEIPDQNGNRPLHVAAQRGNAAFLKALEGAQVHAKNNDGRTPLHLAVDWGNVVGVRELLERGANSDSQDKDKRTPSHMAAASGNSACLKELLAKDAYSDVRDNENRTPLHLASLYGHHECIEVLAKVTNVNAVDSEGNTPLHLASDERCVRVLLEKRANVSAISKDHRTPLHVVAQNGNSGCITMLIRKGVNKNAITDKGATALHLAADAGHVAVIEELLAEQLDKDAQDTNGLTPIHYAVLGGQKKCLKRLVQAGANVNAQDTNGQTPLHFAVLYDQPECLDLLLESGASIDALDNSSNTPLHVAVRQDFVNSANSLLLAGANRIIEDGESQTPVQLAQKLRRLECVNLFLTHKKIYQLCCPDKRVVSASRKRLMAAILSLGKAVATNKELHSLVLLSSKVFLQDAAYVFIDLLTRGGNINHPLFSDVRVLNAAISYILGEIKKQRPHSLLRSLPSSYTSSKSNERGRLDGIVERNARVTIAARRAELLLIGKIREIRALAARESLSPLHYVALTSDSLDNSTAQYADKAGVAALIQYLIDTGEFVDAHVLAKVNNGSTPLHLAAAQGNKNCILILIQNAADINACDARGCTPLHIAAQNGYKSCVDYLLELGANKELCDSENKTAQERLAIFLKNANKIERDAHKEGVSPLIYLTKNGPITYIEYFIKEKKHDVNAKDPQGKTPVHYAATWGKKDCLDLLIKHHAKIDLKDREGKSPLYCALEAYRSTCANRLLELGADRRAVDSYNRDNQMRLSRLTRQVAASIVPTSMGSNQRQMGDKKRKESDNSVQQETKEADTREQEKIAQKGSAATASTSIRSNQQQKNDKKRKERGRSFQKETQEADREQGEKIPRKGSDSVASTSMSSNQLQKVDKKQRETDNSVKHETQEADSE